MIYNKTKLLITLCLGLHLFATAQTDIYKPILSSGKIPPEFTLHVPTMYERTKASLDFSKTDFDKKQRDVFITALVKEEYDYILEGKMVFGDPISARVLPIFEKLKATDKDFATMRCVVVREGTKIFAIGGDIVAVPIEFISQISSESQLAMLMADVMIKFRNHQMEKQMKATNYNPNVVSFDRDNGVNKIISNLGRFQMNTVGLYKENISEALTVLIDAGYKLDDLDFVYSTIKYAYLPYFQGNLTFSEFVGSPFNFSTKDLIESATYKDTFSYDRSGFKEEEEEEEKITDFSPAKYDDMESELTRLLSTKKSSGTFLSMTKKEFEQFLELTQLETIAMDLKQGAYQKVIYNASLMLKKNPTSRALRVFKAQALLSIAQIRLSRMYDEFDLNANFTELSNAYLRLTVEQKGAIAMRYIHENSQLFPDDQQTQKHVNYIQRFMKNEVKINLAGDYKAEEFVYVSKANSNSENEGKELSKLDKIKQKKTEDLTGGDSLQTITTVFHKYGLKSLLEDTKFMKEYSDIKPKKTDAEIEEENKNKKKKEKSLPKVLVDEKVYISVHNGLYYSIKPNGLHKKTKTKETEVVFAKVKGLYDKMNASSKNKNISYSIPDVKQQGEITAEFLNGRFLENMMLNDNIHLKNSFFYGPNYSKRTLKYMHFDFIYAPNTYYNYTSDYFGESKYLIAQDFHTQIAPGVRFFTIPLIFPATPFLPLSPLLWRVEEMGSHGLYDLQNDYFVNVDNSMDYKAFGKLKIYKKSFKAYIKIK